MIVRTWSTRSGREELARMWMIRVYVNGSCWKFGEIEGQSWKNFKAREGQFRDFIISEASLWVSGKEREER
uniref:Uncharacterized protein n=1 Tax=Rhizophora mucronata TaxID=61149 RepID=A0A2P2PJM7_RHIMU